MQKKENFTNNGGHIILRFFDVLPNVPFTTRETEYDYW